MLIGISPQMNTDQHRSDQDFLFKHETHQVIGCAMSVLNTLGHGFLEKPYENALVVELKSKNIPVKQQSKYEILYKGVIVGEYVPDLVVFDQIIIELKTIEKITARECAQMLNYLKVTGLKVGLIFNFSKPELEWKRIVL
jgi:GxxExxY protein